MAIDTVVVTGGSGTIGRAALAELNDHGFHTVNCNRGKPSGGPEDAYRITDLTDPGAVYGSFAAVDPDAVVHLGMLPTPDHHPEHQVFESNAMSSYYVLEAAQALGVGSVVLASSLSAMGAGFEPDLIDPDFLPIDESIPLEPSNSYGMGKQTLETAAAGFGRRDRAPRTITSLRFPWVTSQEEQWETLVQADRRLEGIEATGRIHGDHNTLFSYLDIDDAARAVRLAVEADFEGHEPIFLSAPDTACETPTSEVVERRYPDAERRIDFEGHEALIDTSEAAAVLDWEPRNSWREL
jgi:nucleoside-diphosphate-sugar epimerase